MLKPNVLFMFSALTVVVAIAMFLLSSLDGIDPAAVVAGIVGVVGSVAGIAGASIKELVAPTKTDLQVVLEHMESVAELEVNAGQ